MTWIDEKNAAEADDEDLAQQEQAIKDKMHQEARDNLEAMKAARKAEVISENSLPCSSE